MPISVAMVLALFALGEASVTAQDPATKKSDKPIIVVTGCIDGSWLRVAQGDSMGSYVERYKLRGSKQLMTEMEKKYRGHLVEVTGAVTDTGDTAHRGKTVQVGKKTRITTGAKEIPEHPTGTGDPTLDVQEFRELKDTCK